MEIMHTSQITFGMGSITHVETKKPLVALTFDDGPDEHWTPKILDVLAEYQAKATFFVIGKYVKKHPDIIQRMVNEGHELGNHTWDHPSLPLVSSRERREQILLCDEVLKPFGKQVRLFRPPYYDQSLASCFDMICMGYSVIIGNRAANDWEDRDTKFILDRLKTIITRCSGKVGTGCYFVCLAGAVPGVHVARHEVGCVVPGTYRGGEL